MGSPICPAYSVVSTLMLVVGDLLHVKMSRASQGKATHNLAYQDFRASIPASFVETWERQVLEWEAEPSESNNPFRVETTGTPPHTQHSHSPSLCIPGPTEQKIRRDLAEEAEQRDKQQGIEGLEGNAAVHPSLFVAQGLQLEEDQCEFFSAV